MSGQWGLVSLPTRQQSVLNRMGHALEARDPGLASMFAIFAKLTRDDGPPRTEGLARGPNPVLVMLRAAVRWAGAPGAAARRLARAGRPGRAWRAVRPLRLRWRGRRRASPPDAPQVPDLPVHRRDRPGQLLGSAGPAACPSARRAVEQRDSRPG